MILTITNAGATAVVNGINGIKVIIGSFELGSAYNYIPSGSETALHGTVLYTGTPSNMSVLNNNSVDYSCIVDSTIGPFLFGEVGLFLQNGALFALGSFSSLQTKSSGSQGNVIYIDAIIQATNIAIAVQYVLNTTALSKLAYTASLSNLINPTNAAVNAYLTGDVDNYNNSIYAFQSGIVNKWEFPTHPYKIISGTISTSTSTQVTSNTIGNLLSGLVLGEYIIQFTSGVSTGYIRHIDSTTTNTINWVTALTTTTAVGDSFEVYQSLYSFQLANYANISGLSTQTFAVASAVNPNEAVSLGQGDGRYGQLSVNNLWTAGGTLPNAMPLFAKNSSGVVNPIIFLGTDDNTNIVDSAGIGTIRALNQALNGFVPITIGNGTAANHAVALGQAQADFAALAGLSTQTFAVANAVNPNEAIALGQGDGRYGQLAVNNLWTAGATLPNGMPLSAKDVGGTSRPILFLGIDDNTNIVDATGIGTIRALNQALNGLVPMTIGNGTAANHAVALNQSFAGATAFAVTSTRAFGTVYTNTFGRAIGVGVVIALGTTTGTSTLFVNGYEYDAAQSGNAYARYGVSGIVPPGGTYYVTSLAGAALSGWVEIR